MERKETEYIPYGPEWEKELMKWSKKNLIAMIRRLLNKTVGNKDTAPISEQE